MRPMKYIVRSAVQHKCLPHLACINPTPLLFKKKKIVTNSKNYSEIKKSYYQFVLCKTYRAKFIDI